MPSTTSKEVLRKGGAPGGGDFQGLRAGELSNDDESVDVNQARLILNPSDTQARVGVDRNYRMVVISGGNDFGETPCGAGPA